MSTYCSFAGISIKLKNKFNTEEYHKKIAHLLNYSKEEIDNIEESFYIIPINKWRIHKDVFGGFGLIYLLENEFDVTNINYTISLNDAEGILNLIIYKLDKSFLDKSNENNVKIFAHLYYNGVDNPFKF